jgi:hypothetical protein
MANYLNHRAEIEQDICKSRELRAETLEDISMNDDPAAHLFAKLVCDVMIPAECAGQQHLWHIWRIRDGTRLRHIVLLMKRE